MILTQNDVPMNTSQAVGEAFIVKTKRMVCRYDGVSNIGYVLEKGKTSFLRHVVNMLHSDCDFHS